MRRAVQLASQLFISSSVVAVLWLAVVVSPLAAQAPKGTVKTEDPPPALTYHGLVPGLSTSEEVRKALGTPTSEASWYAYKLLYPAKDRPGLVDSVHLHGKEGAFACAEAASVPEGYENRKAIEA